MKKLHWTQTIAGKKKLRASIKKGWETRHDKAVLDTDEEFDDEDCCKFCGGDFNALPKHEYECKKNPKNKKRSKMSDTRIVKGAKQRTSLHQQVLAMEERAVPFEKQMIVWNGWEILAEDAEQNCLIVKVPLGKQKD